MHSRHQSTSPRKSSRHASSSSAPLSTLDQSMAVPSGAHSLAHELAFALMPDPGASSRLLAEEFGIEYDEGAEGIDGDAAVGGRVGVVNGVDEELDGGTSLADELGDGAQLGGTLADEMGAVHEESQEFRNGVANAGDENERAGDEEDDDGVRTASLAQDAMDILARDLASTDQFLARLRAIDLSYAIENLVSDGISKINDTVREREGQVRELIACDRDLKRIAGEVGGIDVLGNVDPLDDFVLEDEPQRQISHAIPKLEAVVEEEDIEGNDGLGEGESNSLYSPSFPPSPQKPSFASSHPRIFQSLSSSTMSSSKPSPNTDPSSSISTLGIAIPGLTHFRTNTASFLASLTIISEQSQVNSAATADAGRKIRLLKNQLAKWKVETEGAERSRTKIERWVAEGGIGGRRDGREVVDEHMRAFENAIAEAGMKTQAIMAR